MSIFQRSLGRNSWGVERVFHFDPYTDEAHVEYKQDVGPVLEANKKLQNDPDTWKNGMKHDMVLYGRIPVNIQYKWIQEYGAENDPMKPENAKLLFQLLNSPEYRYLKCVDKTIYIK